MKKSIVVVESPAKAKTIEKYLGASYKVVSSVGHIRDLKKKGMSVYPENNWAADYEVDEGKQKFVASLKQSLKSAEELVLATDLDREGEAIGWHILQAIGMDVNDEKYRRISFNAITKSAIQSAINTGRKIDVNLVNAQQTRRFLDRVVGFNVSPLLLQRFGRWKVPLSAGRVQTVTLRLIYDRELEIIEFVPIETWLHKTEVALESGSEWVTFQVQKYQDKKLQSSNIEQATVHHDQLQAAIQAKNYKVADVTSKPSPSRPLPPFITSTLQQACAQRGIAIDRAMRIAQNLYEAGHITYMRTDSTFLAPEAIASIRTQVAQEHPQGEAALPATPNYYKSGKSAQEAHEAIRPTDFARTPQQLATTLKAEDLRVYKIIYDRTMASQCKPALLTRTVVSLAIDDYVATAEGKQLVELNCFHYWPVSAKDIILPDFAVDKAVQVQEPTKDQMFSKPPARYTQASMVKEMEKRGIGRPSTYANTVKTVLDRKYIEQINKKMFLTDLGRNVMRRLSSSFPEIVAYDFTAAMENNLDRIAQGEDDWRDTLDKFYKDFKLELDQAKEHMESLKPLEVDAWGSCQECGKEYLLRYSHTGPYVSCAGRYTSGFSSGKTSKSAAKKTDETSAETTCKAPSISLQDFFSVLENQKVESKELADSSAERADNEAEGMNFAKNNRYERRDCPKCGMACIPKVSKDKLVSVCFNSPDCSGFLTSPLPNDWSEITHLADQQPTYPCARENCQGTLTLMDGRFGPFYNCSACEKNVGVAPGGKPEAPKMDPIATTIKCVKFPTDTYLLREGKNNSLFFAASKFPKNKETRVPLVEEILPFMPQLPAHFQHIKQAPLKDPNGLPTALRHSRVLGEIRIGSMQENKKYSSFLLAWDKEKGTWNPVAAAKKPAAKRKATKAK